jgi:glucose uptake protein GlcU
VINPSVEGVDRVDEVLISVKTSLKMRIIGYILAIVSGIFFGLVFTPSTYIQDHKDKYPGAKKNGLNYVFSMYTGILLASTFYYSIYIIAKRNRPHIHIESILPAFISGVMWGIAQAAFIFANSVLSQAISFPLISTGPATIAALWSIFYIKDIIGRRNYLIFSIGTFFRILAAVFIVLSQPISS